MTEAFPFINQAMQRAQMLMQDGRPTDAEAALIEAAKDVEERYGVNTPEHAEALNAIGVIQLHTGQMQRARASFEASCFGIPPGSYQGPADRNCAGHLDNLAMALRNCGELERSAEISQQAIVLGRELYGADHYGYAMSLQPYAEVLLRLGKVNEARATINEALKILRKHEHDMLPRGVVLRAEILAEAGSSSLQLAEESLSARHIDQLTLFLFQRLGQFDETLGRRILAELLTLVERSYGPETPATANVLAAIANFEGALEERADHDLREKCIRRTIDINYKQGHNLEALDALLGLALALAQAKRSEEAVATYHEAIEKADQIGNASLQARARMNFGNCLADLERREEAEPILIESVRFATKAGHPEIFGLAQLGYGIFLQHGGQLDEAREKLEDALSFLDETHPMAFCGKSHLDAIVNQRSCGCGNTHQASADSLRDFILG